MIELSAAQIAALCGGTLAPGTDLDLSIAVAGISTDSRSVTPGSMYVAKPGEVSDGHDYVQQAFAAGARLTLAEREVLDPSAVPYPAVIVPDAVVAMGEIAKEVLRLSREASELSVIGITGSAGKTTTKDLLAGILATAGKTVSPQGSFNGEVGVPLTVFQLELDTRYLVVEMGATKIGNINYLTQMVEPEVGVVLCVGSAHAGEFGSIENIAIAKGEMVESLPANGTAILNYDDARVRSMTGRSSAPITYFTSAEAELGDVPANSSAVTASNVRTEDGHPHFDLHFPGDPESYPVASKLLGLHHVANLLAAASAAYAVGISPETIAQSLSEQGPASRYRMEISELAEGITLINDAYNANPESMRAALRTLAELGQGGRRTWAVLGEMLELGEGSILEHDAIGRVVVRLNISRLVVVGAGARSMHVGAVMEGSWGEESVFVADTAAALSLLEQELAPGDIVLVKSSNGSGLRFLGDQIALAAGPRENIDGSEPVPPGGSPASASPVTSENTSSMSGVMGSSAPKVDPSTTKKSDERN